MAKKQIGKIVNFFGLKGQLKVSITTSNPEERFKPGKKIIIQDENKQDQEYIITSLMIKNDKIIHIGLDGYDDINQINKFIGKNIYQDVKAKKGTFFYDDLIGLKVFDINNTLIGEVDHIEKMPANEYLVINKTIYIPFIMDKFIKNVDLDKKEIYLTELGSESIK